MQRLPVESSDLVSIGYDPAAKVLEVEFQGGRIYQYRDVEPDIYTQFMRTDSFGTFFFAHINGRYRYQKVSGTDETQTGDQSLAFAGADPDDLHSLQVACEPYDIDIEPLDVPLDEIQSEDAEDIALKKAKQAFRLASQPVVVVVTSWNILSLRGFPGAYAEAISRWLTTEELLKLLDAKSDRTVTITRVLAYYDGKRHKIFSQDYWGTIVENPRGEGSSLESLAVIQGQEKTIAEARQTGQLSWVTPEGSAWQEFAKWLRLQRRLRTF